MAVTKLWPVTKNLGAVIDYAQNPEKTERANSRYAESDRQALKDVLAYAVNEEKTEQEFFCQGIHCNVETAREQFITVKEQYGKTDGIQAYHGYLSFKEQEISPELAQKIGMEFAQRVWGDRFQVVVTTHLNTQHLHCHFVINSVSFADGKRCQDTSWFKFRHIADEICKKYQLHTIEKPERNPDSKYLTKKDQAGMPTRYNIARAAIDEAIAMSTTMVQLQRELGKMGCSFDGNEKHKYWTITLRGDQKPIRLYRLGEEYTKQRIAQRLEENRHNVHFEPFQPKTCRPRQYVLRTRKDRIGKIGGLYGLYLRNCYALGILPKYHSQNPARVHPLLRQDLMKLEELTAQTQLLGRHHIGDTGQLLHYRQSVEAEIDTLTAERTHLRNEIRKVNVTDAERSADQEKIGQITEKLKNLRKEIKLCNGILERSGDIRERLERAVAEEEIQNQKEKDRYEHKR